MKTALKMLNATGYIGLNWLTGYAVGTLLGKIAGLVLTEKLAEEHTWLFWILFILYMAMVVVAAVGIALIDPWRKLYEFFDNKIDPEKEKDEFDD